MAELKGLRHRDVSPYWAEMLQGIAFLALAAIYAATAVADHGDWFTQGTHYLLVVVWLSVAVVHCMVARTARRRALAILMTIELHPGGFSVREGVRQGIVYEELPQVLRWMADSIEKQRAAE